MKKIKMIAFALLITFLTIPTNNTYASENAKAENNLPDTMKFSTESFETEQYIEDIFSGMNDSDKVLEAPRGGYFSGEGDINGYDESGNLIITHNVETDPNSITVAEAKEKIASSAENKSMLNLPMFGLRGATPPTVVYELRAEQSYKSDDFSGSGWRYSGYKFLPSAGTGSFLRWNTFNDDAKVMMGYESWLISMGAANPNNVGQPIYRGYTYWKSWTEIANGAVQPQVYFTFNPVRGSYYIVANTNKLS